MRILYLTQWFEPEPNIIKGLAFVRALQAAGHEVTVVTGLPNYPAGRLYPGYRMRLIQREMLEGVAVTRLALYPSHDKSALRRSLNFLSFFLAVLAYCLLRARKFDLAYVYHPPITVGLAAALAGCVRRLPFLLDVQDLWPETVSTTGLRGADRLSPAIRMMCAFTYARAALIVAQSQGMGDALAGRGVPSAKLRVIRNWATAEQPLPDQPTDPAERAPFTIVYAGNFGRAQGLSTVIEAARILARERQDIAIRLIGDGVDSTALHEQARGVSGISVEDHIPQAEMQAVFADADALLLHLRNEPLFDITIPSKTQAYLAAGRPIVAGVGGEAASLLNQAEAGFVVAPEDARALAGAIGRMADAPRPLRRSMGASGRRFYQRNLSFASGMEHTLAALHSAAGKAAA
jgi:glycosyltransferase involved in cell wall biosynthesis